MAAGVVPLLVVHTHREEAERNTYGSSRREALPFFSTAVQVWGLSLLPFPIWNFYFRVSIPLDDKNCLIVNTIFLANLSQTIVSL
jgi:hypothetical protein